MTCRHFGTCGGCSVAGVPYTEQLARKRAWLKNLLGVDVPPLIPSPRESAFRQKAAFVFGSGRGRGLVMGHYAAGSRRVVPIDECPVHSARANRVAFALRDRLARANIAAADRGGPLRHLIIRATGDDREAVAMLVVSRNDKALRAPVRSLLASADSPDGFFININTRPGPYMIGDETIRIAGRSRVRERALRGAAAGVAIDYLVSPDAFFQTNVAAARELVTLVLEDVGQAGRVLDLYCGSGLFALPIAQRGSSVTAVEENRQAIADLKANMALNRVPSDRVVPMAARVEDALARASRAPWDAVVLDPPREGCAPGVLATIVDRLAPPRVIYISCNPEALARELPIMLAGGYRIARIQPVDMFPHTDHIETVLTLRRVS